MSEFPVRLAWTDFIYELADLLNEKAVQIPIYLVGGAVRDAYLRAAITDIDIAVDGDAIALARRVTDWLDGDIYVMDRERGVARVFVTQEGKAICIDFARFRGKTLEDDLRDRDFTMNAMAADLLGEVESAIDPLKGAADLRRKVLRRCSPNSIADDPIRVLRAVRLSVQFNLRLDPETVSDLRLHAPGLSQSSRERIRDEFFKLLGLDRSTRGLRVLRHLGALGEIIPGAKDIDEADWALSLAIAERMTAIQTAISSRRTDNTAAAFEMGMLMIQFDRYRRSLQAHLARQYGNGRSHGQLLILAALLHTGFDADTDAEANARSNSLAKEVADALRLSALEARRLRIAIDNRWHVVEQADWTILDQHRFWYQLGDSGIDVILLGAAHVLGAQGRELKQAEWLKLVEAATILLDGYFNRYDEIVSPRMLLDGNDIRALLGIKSGPLVGQLLTALREAQVMGEVATEEAAREFVLREAEARAP